MSDPFKIDGPTCLSLSGGRTSALMLRRTLDANPIEVLQKYLLIAFANTGKEDEATLRFVNRIDFEWCRPLDLWITWLEYRSGMEDGGSLGAGPLPEATYARVNYVTASREGEPFEALIRRRKFLPNPVSRFCTSELKIRTMHRYIRAQREWPEWDQFIGIRADEQRRVAKIRARGVSTETKDETMCMPLADAGVSVQDVGAFWDAQPFNLELLTVNGRTLEGNCDLCFLKPPAQRFALIKKKPTAPIWWIRMESLALSDKPEGARFCKDGPSYADLTKYAAEQRDMFDPDEEAIACFCGD
jgi:3'-phosphoadenosine 5'-phosphosulfate sulfotransferase (PAPS reductase)/FAD synthetase